MGSRFWTIGTWSLCHCLKWVAHRLMVKWKGGCISFGSTASGCNTRAEGTLLSKTIASGATERYPLLRQRYAVISLLLFWWYLWNCRPVCDLCGRTHVAELDINCDYVVILYIYREFLLCLWEFILTSGLRSFFSLLKSFYCSLLSDCWFDHNLGYLCCV